MSRAADRHTLDSLVARANADVDTGDVSTASIAAGYADRMRLGMSNPFRLANMALSDTRLPPNVAEIVARSLVERAARGDGYEIDPRIFEGLSGDIAAPDAMSSEGAHFHWRMVLTAVDSAKDPRAGELAVRLAYQAAHAERIVSARVLQTAIHVAALRRDRAFARHDALALLEAARDSSGPVLTQALVEWRVARRFVVERPPVADAANEFEVDGVALAERMVVAIRAQATNTQPILVDSSPRFVGATVRESSYLSARAGRRLAQTAAGLPPHPAVIVPLATLRSRLLSGGAHADRSARRRFVDRASNEESFAGELAIVLAGVRRSEEIQRAVIDVAVALRAFAQEVPRDRFASDPIVDVGRRYRLRAVTFERSMTTSWRSHSAATLAHALDDIRSVFPSLDVRGLRVHFGPSPKGSVALALHDPRSRTLFLPPRTASGAVAHELAHDLDWLAIERGSYSTDRLIRQSQRQLATAVRRLVSDSLRVPAPDAGLDMGYDPWRPTEVFARQVDWFVAASLAAGGRSNGHLSAVQDEALPGYAGATPPDPTGNGAAALLDILGAMTVVAPGARLAYQSRYGGGRSLSAAEVARVVLDVPPPQAVEFSDISVASRMESSMSLPSAALDSICSLEFTNTTDRVLARSRFDAARLIADGRARGLIRRWAAVPGAALPVPAVGPVRPEYSNAFTARVRESLLVRAHRVWSPNALGIETRQVCPLSLPRSGPAMGARRWPWEIIDDRDANARTSSVTPRRHAVSSSWARVD